MNSGEEDIGYSGPAKNKKRWPQVPAAGNEPVKIVSAGIYIFRDYFRQILRSGPSPAFALSVIADLRSPSQNFRVLAG